MNEDPLVLTLDFGTQSVRVALVDKLGSIKHIVKESYSPAYFSKEKGYAEQEPDFYWDLAVKCLKKLVSEAKNELNNIIGCTITTFRDTSVQLDKDLKPIKHYYLGDQDAINAKINAVKNQDSVKK